MAATVAGAAVGGVIGYLFFTPEGRTLRRQIEPTIEDLARELASFRTTVHKAAGVANDGWRLLNEVKVVTTKVKEETERVDEAIRTTLHRVDDTADRVRSNVRMKTSRVVGFVRGLRVAIESMLHSRDVSEMRT